MDKDKLNIYVKGFEHGYWLKRGDSPELDGIINRSNHAYYKNGLMAGKKEAERQRVRDRLEKNNDQHAHDKNINID